VSWIRRTEAIYRLLFQRQELEQDLEAEVEAYFEILVDRYMEQGMTKEEARRAARVKFGGPEQVKEKVREVRIGAMIEAAFKDLRYASRMLRKNPGFAAVAVCSLAIGIGATSGIYSIADKMLLRPLPVPRSSGVIAVTPITDQLFAALNGFVSGL
jgi:hypothetical protein